MTLGTLSLGLTFRHAADVGYLPVWAGEAVLFLGGAVWLALAGAYVYKWLCFRELARAEWQDVTQVCFLSLLPVTAMLFASALAAYVPAARYIAYAAVAAQVALAAWRGLGLWRGLEFWQAAAPLIYLPVIAANFVSAATLAHSGCHDGAVLFFGAGLLSWAALEPRVSILLRTGHDVPFALRGVAGIQTAPAFVCCGAYFSLNGGAVDCVALGLMGYGLLQVLLQFRLLPWVFARGFVMSGWSYSFGQAAMAACGLQLVVRQSDLAGLGWVMWVSGSANIALLWVLTIRLMRRGGFLLRG